MIAQDHPDEGTNLLANFSVIIPVNILYDRPMPGSVPNPFAEEVDRRTPLVLGERARNVQRSRRSLISKMPTLGRRIDACRVFCR